MRRDGSAEDRLVAQEVTDRPSPMSMWDERYGTSDYVYGTEPNEFLRVRVADVAPGDALCLADGEGRNSVFLAEQGFRVSAVDLSGAGVAKALALAAERGVTIDSQQGDLATFDLGEDRWDLIVSIFAHVPPGVRGALHARVARALRPGGRLILEAYTPDQIGRGTGGPPTPEMTMTLAGLRGELVGLEFVHGEELLRDVVEGPGHTGTGAVVQVIARRPSTG